MTRFGAPKTPSRAKLTAPKTPSKKVNVKRKKPVSPSSDMSSGLKPPSKLRPPARKEENEASGGFVVGDRVLAAGKKGKVAFLGETEFASGQWAGIILDDPVGMLILFYKTVQQLKNKLSC